MRRVGLPFTPFHVGATQSLTWSTSAMMSTSRLSMSAVFSFPANFSLLMILTALHFPVLFSRAFQTVANEPLPISWLNSYFR